MTRTWLSDAAVDHLRDVADWPVPVGDRYEIVEPVARGGMGAVYRARDRALDRIVAVKVISPTAVGADAIARMRREARVLARLEHPGIVPVYDVGELDDGRLFYVMKLVQGPRLDDHVAERPLTERLRIFTRICEPVAFAHAHGVIHRDLKPENVMVGPFGEVLVLDWGASLILDWRCGRVQRVRAGAESSAVQSHRAVAPARGHGAPGSEGSSGWELGAASRVAARCGSVTRVNCHSRSPRSSRHPTVRTSLPVRAARDRPLPCFDRDRMTWPSSARRGGARQKPDTLVSSCPARAVIRRVSE
jgi:serine/threonine protein kinase